MEMDDGRFRLYTANCPPACTIGLNRSSRGNKALLFPGTRSFADSVGLDTSAPGNKNRPGIARPSPIRWVHDEVDLLQVYSRLLQISGCELLLGRAANE